MFLRLYLNLSAITPLFIFVVETLYKQERMLVLFSNKIRPLVAVSYNVPNFS